MLVTPKPNWAWRLALAWLVKACKASSARLERASRRAKMKAKKRILEGSKWQGLGQVKTQKDTGV